MIAAYIARMIEFLQTLGTNINRMSLTGHSLGAHVIGLSGFHTTMKVGHIVGKITNIL